MTKHMTWMLPLAGLLLGHGAARGQMTHSGDRVYGSDAGYSGQTTSAAAGSYGGDAGYSGYTNSVAGGVYGGEAGHSAYTDSVAGGVYGGDDGQSSTGNPDVVVDEPSHEPDVPDHGGVGPGWPGRPYGDIVVRLEKTPGMRFPIGLSESVCEVRANAVTRRQAIWAQGRLVWTSETRRVRVSTFEELVRTAEDEPFQRRYGWPLCDGPTERITARIGHGREFVIEQSPSCSSPGQSRGDWESASEALRILVEHLC